LADELIRRNQSVTESLAADASPELKQKGSYDLKIIQGTLRDEPFKKGIEHLDLTYENFTNRTGAQLSSYLQDYKALYQKKYNEQSQLVEQKKAFIQKQGFDLAKEKNEYYNESLADLVRNVTTESRMLEHNGVLIQQINPVYQYADTTPAWNYRTAFFFPEKNLLGIRINTFAFDLMVIWLMSFVFYLTLYFEVFKKLVNSFGSRSGA
jgi:hypothetical protein